MVVGGGGWGLHSHFRVQPNYSVEVVLCCRWGCDNYFFGWVAGEMENQAIASSNLKLKLKLSLAKIQVDSCFVMLCCVDVVEL